MLTFTKGSETTTAEEKETIRIEKLLANGWVQS